MELTEENKAHIDSLNYESLLAHWRYAPAGDPWFQGETGKYWDERMRLVRDGLTPGEAVGISKKLG